MNKMTPKQRAYDSKRYDIREPVELQGIPFEEGVPLDSSLNFERRILYPSQYPVLEARDEKGNPQAMTHLMETAEVDMDGERVPIAYPTIIQAEDGSLLQLDSDAAFEHAMKSGEFRRFSSPEAAQLYSQGLYKRAWGKGDQAEAYMKQLEGGR